MTILGAMSSKYKLTVERLVVEIFLQETEQLQTATALIVGPIKPICSAIILNPLDLFYFLLC